MIRQEIPLLRNNELPSAASYNALANPIRNITSLTPEMLRITQNRSNGGLQFEILPHTHVKAAEEEKEEFSLNCSFLITVGEKNANNEYPVTVNTGYIFYFTNKINYEYIGKDSFNAPQTTHIYIEINIYTHKATLVKFNNFLQWPYSDKTIYFYIGQVKIDNTSATVTQNHLGDVYFDLRYKQLKNTAFISDDTLYLTSSYYGNNSDIESNDRYLYCYINCDGKEIAHFNWENEFPVQANYGVYAVISIDNGLFSEFKTSIEFIPNDSAVDTYTTMYVPLVTLSNKSISFIAEQYINVGGRWV